MRTKCTFLLIAFTTVVKTQSHRRASSRRHVAMDLSTLPYASSIGARGRPTCILQFTVKVITLFAVVVPEVPVMVMVYCPDVVPEFPAPALALP
jgi:hypothetical protein